MTYWFLIFPLMLHSGQPSAKPVLVFMTEEECSLAGKATSADVRADKDIKQAVWSCIGVDFDIADPLPAKHVPGKNEA